MRWMFTHSISNMKVCMWTCLCFIMLLSYSCEEKRKPVTVDVEKLKEQMMEANRRLVKSESLMIDSFITKNGYKMETTGTGLRFASMKSGKGSKAEAGDTLMIAYQIWLLNGTLCEESKPDQPLVLIIGENKHTKGFEEAILKMTEKETARIIVPSYLAYGMKGDGNLIPAASPLHCVLTLIDIKE